MQSLVLISFAWATQCLATAVPKCTTYTDNFDGISVKPVVPLVDPIGQQNGLQYNDFKYLNLNSAGSGLKPQSSPNVAGGALPGNLAGGSLQLAASGSIVGTEYTPYFDLNELYYGCYIYEGPQTLVIAASACVLAITGFDYQDKPVSAVAAAFAPSGSILNRFPLSYQSFSGFTKMKNVTIGVSAAEPLTAAGVLVMDNLKHCNYPV